MTLFIKRWTSNKGSRITKSNKTKHNNLVTKVSIDLVTTISSMERNLTRKIDLKLFRTLISSLQQWVRLTSNQRKG